MLYHKAILTYVVLNIKEGSIDSGNKVMVPLLHCTVKF